MAAASTEQIRSALERAGAQADARRPLPQREWLAPVLAVALLGMLGWIALFVHGMNARLGVVETRLVALEEGHAKLEADLEAGLAQASAERRELGNRLGGRIDDLARRLPPPR